MRLSSRFSGLTVCFMALVLFVFCYAGGLQFSIPGTRTTLLPSGISASRFIPIAIATNRDIILAQDTIVTRANMLNDAKPGSVLNRTSQQRQQAEFLEAAASSDERSSPSGNSPGARLLFNQLYCLNYSCLLFEIPAINNMYFI